MCPNCTRFKSQLVEDQKARVSVRSFEWFRYRMYIYRLSFSPERQDAPYSCTARVHPMARFDGEVQFIAIRVLMQPRSSLVNRQLFNKYFHSHHYYLGGSPKIAHVRMGREEEGARAMDTITRISTSIRIHISTLYTRDSPALFSCFFNTLDDRDNGRESCLYYWPVSTNFCNCVHDAKNPQELLNSRTSAKNRFIKELNIDGLWIDRIE